MDTINVEPCAKCGLPVSATGEHTCSWLCSICERVIGSKEPFHVYVAQHTGTLEWRDFKVCNQCNESMGKPQAGDVITVNE